MGKAASTYRGIGAQACPSQSSQAADGRDEVLAALCGEGRDRKHSSYSVSFDGPDSLSVTTRRPDGKTIHTSKLIKRTAQGVTWGARATFWLEEPVTKHQKEIRW